MSRYFFYMTPEWVMLDDAYTQQTIRLECRQPIEFIPPDMTDQDRLTLLNHSTRAMALLPKGRWRLMGFQGAMTVCRVVQNALYRAQECVTVATCGDTRDMRMLAKEYKVSVQRILRVMLYGSYTMNKLSLSQCHTTLEHQTPQVVLDHYAVVMEQGADDYYLAMVRYVLKNKRP